MVDESRKILHTFTSLTDLGQEIANGENLPDMIRTSLHLILGTLAIMRGAVAKFSRFENELNFIAARGLGDDFPLSLTLSGREISELAQIGLQVIDFDRENALSVLFLGKNARSLRQSGIALVVPLVVRDELVGLILLGKKIKGDDFTSNEREIISVLARHIAVGIQQRNLMADLNRKASENLSLYKDLRTTYTATVKAFAAAIDCKDKYTQGHSERVGKYAEAIAREIGWDEKSVEGVAVGGYLHDVGKLIIEKDVINSPNPLSESQFDELSKHPEIGFEILAPLSHPYADIPLAAKYHHERLDGRGYPDGLRGNEIPYIAKIICLADCFDAMTTDRPYRARRNAVQVIADLQRNTGSQFAPELVEAFARVMLRELTDEKRPQRILKLLDKGYMDKSAAPALQKLLDSLGNRLVLAGEI